MPETDQPGVNHVRTPLTKVMRAHCHDWSILLLIIATGVSMYFIEPFHRFIGEDTMQDLKYPLKGNSIPSWTVPIYSILLPILVFVANYIFRRDVYDLHHATLGLLYSIGLTIVITNAFNLSVGRPRPDFFYRCFPDGKAVFDNVTHNAICHGEKKLVTEGYKSFPSGHASESFSGLVFLSWYMSGKFNIRFPYRAGQMPKLCLVFLPILAAALVGVSRMDDYWHHWQDIFVGAMIGFALKPVHSFRSDGA
ncbi:hypothetical protein SAY87_004290 [Trapa incisa]|uniref:Phosphatidic acid phosphatase type 2/haloperoxidase domain-containing protein n=1 Tax=Trapa incisa TaxID=236973 RepID=A0AAN7JPQ7_9MYRT|nr:hypothetical protein SAY87_004290 [Trapa incisa]